MDNNNNINNQPYASYVEKIIVVKKFRLIKQTEILTSLSEILNELFFSLIKIYIDKFNFEKKKVFNTMSFVVRKTTNV